MSDNLHKYDRAISEECLTTMTCFETIQDHVLHTAHISGKFGEGASDEDMEDFLDLYENWAKNLDFEAIKKRWGVRFLRETGIMVKQVICY